MLPTERKTKGKLFFTEITRFQLKYHFRRLKSYRSELPFNNFMDPPEIPLESSQYQYNRQNDRLKLPAIAPGLNKSNIMIPPSNNFHGLQQLQTSMYQDKDKYDQSLDKIESPAVVRNQNNENFQMPIELLNFLKEKDLLGSKALVKKNKGMPLKIGDIIFFKFTPELTQIKNTVQGVVTGDGIASNKIECVSCESNMQKNALNMFRKSLFRIENNKKYNYTKKYLQNKDHPIEFQNKKDKIPEDEYKKILKILEQKAKDEKEDNVVEYKKIEGQTIIYGQSIQLKHIYSDCYLTLKSEDLARQNGCVEMTLEETDTEHSNFKFLPINNLRNMGDVVSYSDVVNLVSFVEENYYLHVASELLSLAPNEKQMVEDAMSNGLEVNGSEIQTNLKVNCYLNYTESKKNEEISGKFLLNGDIITIFNRELGSVLATAQRNIKEYFIDKSVIISNGDDKFGAQAQNSFNIKVLSPEKIIESDIKLKLYIEKQSSNIIDHRNFNSLWEIQRKKTFDGSVLNIDEPFRLKNVATGLFLCINSNNQPELTNIAINDSSSCYFNFVSKFNNDGKEKSIKYDEALKIKLSSKNMFLGCSNKNDVSFSDKKGDSTKFLFEIKPSDQKSRNFADRISSLVPYLMKFYLFLQNFGISSEPNKQKNNEDSTTLRYDYEKALHHEKDLENEIKQLFESLQNLNNFLKIDLNQEDETMFRWRQNILNDQRIIEILIAITKLIDQMCRGNLNVPEPREKVVKKHDRQNSSYKNLEKTPFAIAKKHLEKPMKEIFEFLYLSIKGNERSSQFILEFDDFFKTQLKFFFKEMSILLKEAVRCSFLLKPDDHNGNQIIEWIKLLENLNESAKNIENQALYLELIAYALIDSNDAPVPTYQEKCLQEIFPNKQNKQNRLIKYSNVFDGEKERAAISFQKEEKIDDFRDNNPSLQGLTPIRGSQFNDDVATYYIDEFNESSKGNLSPFIDYICANLKLLSYLIKGRNLKSMKKVKMLGLTSEHVKAIVTNPNIQEKIKANYLHLFQYLFLDKEPFTHLSRYENRCIIWNDLDKFAMANQTYGLINNIELQIKSSEEGQGQKAKDDYNSIQNLLNTFWSEKGLDEFDLKFFEEKQDKHEKNEKQEECDRKMKELSNKIELFMSFLKLTRVVVDLGYSNKQLNDNILYGIGHIFAPIMEEKITEDGIFKSESIIKRNGLNMNYWIMKFMKTVIKAGESDHQTRIKEEIESILHQTTKIFMIFTKIRINLQIINFLKTFKSFQNNTKKIEEFNNFEYLFHIYDFNVQPSLLIDKTHKKVSNENENSLLVPFFENLVQHNLDIYQDQHQEGLHLDSIFLYSLFSMSFMSVRLRKNLLQILVDYFNQRTVLLSELIETEIIDTDEELKIYHELDGITSMGEKVVVSIKRLENLLEKLLHYNEYSKYYKTNNSINPAKQEKINQIIAIVDLINAKFKERKLNPYLFLKTQNILRNLQYHEIFFKILKKLSFFSFSSDMDETQLINKILTFFNYFTYLNGINQQQILTHYEIFFNLMSFRFSINRLFSSSLEIVKSSTKIIDYINILFDFIENVNSNNLNNRIFIQIQVISVLQSLITNQEKVFMPKIQKKILARLLKNKKLLKFTLSKSYIEYKNNMMGKVKDKENPEKHLEKLTLHLKIIHLFGNLCRNFKMGTLQMQKVLVYEQMKNLLFDLSTPFVFKKVYLKALFQIYIVQITEVNQNYAPNDMADILNQLVLPDLTIYTKYLEGIVRIEGVKPDLIIKHKEFRERIIEKLNYYQSSLEVQLEGDKTTGTQGIFNKKQTNISIGSSGPSGLKMRDDPSEYWEYLFGGKTWDNSRDGLLYFLMDCYYEANKRGWLKELFDSNDSLTDALSMIKSCLVRMKGTLQKLEKDFSINLSNYYLMITEAIARLPTKVVTKAGKALKIQNDAKGNYKMEKINVRDDQDLKIVDEDQNNNNLKDISDVLLDKIRTLLIIKRMKIGDFLNLFNLKLEIVPKDQFLDNFLTIVNDENIAKVGKTDIESLIEKWAISKNGPDFVNFRKFCEKMRRFYIKKKFNYEDEENKRDKKEINIEETENSFKKDNLLMKFIMSYYNNSLNKKRNDEIRDLAIKFKKNLEILYDNSENEEELFKGYVDSVKKMIMVFSAEFSSIFLIKILRIFLEQNKPPEVKINDDMDDEEIKKIMEDQLLKKKHFKFLQEVFEKAGVCAYGLTFIKAKTPLLYVYEAISLLINCLEFGNNNIQISILNILRKEISLITSPFFNFIKNFLIHQGRDTEFDNRLLKKSKFKIDQFTQDELIQLNDDKFINKDTVVISLVKLLSLFCENCNTPFQNFLREQTFDQTKLNFVSNNIILETSNLLTFLSSGTKANIVAETFKTLTEFNLGPCNENQSILCNNKRLINYINDNILKIPINFKSVTDEEDDKILVFSKTIEFLLSLVIGHKDNENIIKLISTLEISEIFSKMNNIFKKRIKSYIKPILQEDPKYLDDYCLNIIKTGFNIFILLTIFKEAFPNHNSLHLLNLNLSFSKKKYEELKEKFKIRRKEINHNKHSKKVTPIYSPRNKKKPSGTYIDFERTTKSKSQFLKLEEEEKSLSAMGNNDELEHLKRNSEKELDNERIKLDLEKDLLRQEFKDYYEMKAIKDMKASLLFYKGLVGSVEVKRGEELSKIYFQKPFVSDFKTPNIKYNLIYKANRESDQARLEHLFYNKDNYHQEMKHRQRMYRYRLLNFFIEFWRSLKDISFMLIIIINLILLASYANVNGHSQVDGTLNTVSQIFTIIQLLICFFVVIFCMIERYPVSIHAEIGKFTAVKKNSLKNIAGLDISNRGYFNQFVINTEIKIENFFKLLEDSRYRAVKILFDMENIYNLAYLAITLVAFFNPLVYCLLLLDLIKRSEDLQNIIKAITLNVGSLLKTAILGAAVLFMFSIVGFLQFEKFYNSTGNSIVYADTLLHAYTSTLNSGLRAGGGIGDALTGPTIDDPKYWNYWGFTLSFYIIINILFINIIFGIIIDTFGELRDMRKELIKDVEEKCFICGVDSYDFETKGNGWLDHIYLEHNVYHYLDFLIYISEKNVNDCNGIEKYVKELVNKKSIEFIPIGRALALKEQKDEKE